MAEDGLLAETAAKAASKLTRALHKGRRGSPELIGRVRFAVYELMSKREITELLEERLRRELLGMVDKDDKLRITPLMIRIAVNLGEPDHHGSAGPDQHLHLHGFASAEEAVKYAESRIAVEPEEP